MSFIQRLAVAILPRSTSRSLEHESRSWIVRCPGCQHERTVWDLGGIRWGAAGKPRWRLKCRQCEQTGWHEVFRREE